MTIDSDNLLNRLEKMSPAINNHAKAKSNRVYIEKYLKSKKALLIIEAKENKLKTGQERESYAYAHQEYIELLKGLKEATEIEEKHRWSLERLKMELEVWRSLNANDRFQKERV